MLSLNKNIISYSHCIRTIFVLTSYSLYKQVMLILILIDVQYFTDLQYLFLALKKV